MTPDQKRDRAISALTRRVDRITDRDRQWFELRPWRNHRLRPAEEVELQLLATSNRMREPPPGLGYFFAIKQVEPGHRLRVTWLAAVGRDVDFGEANCARIFGIATAEPNLAVGL